MSRAIDWGPVKTAYVTSTKSYKRIAAEHNLPFASVARKGKEDGWPAHNSGHEKHDDGTDFTMKMVGCVIAGTKPVALTIASMSLT